MARELVPADILMPRHCILNRLKRSLILSYKAVEALRPTYQNCGGGKPTRPAVSVGLTVPSVSQCLRLG